MVEDWKRNIWTGNDILNVSPNERIIRAGTMYRAEFWGDYSLDFPKKGDWRNSLGKAKADLPALK